MVLAYQKAQREIIGLAEFFTFGIVIHAGLNIGTQCTGRAAFWNVISKKELLIDMLCDDQRSKKFMELAQAVILPEGPVNDKSSEYFARDGEIVNRVRPALQEMGYCGIRMAFCLGKPVADEGNLHPNQHIQICLWDSSVIRNPKQYIPGLIG